MSETLSFHEYAQLFPMLPLEELDALADDILTSTYARMVGRPAMTPTIEELLTDLGWQVDVVIDDTSSILDTLLAGERAGHLVSVIATACVAQTERVAELQHIAAQTMEWAAGYPHSPISDELAVSMIYDLCVRAGIGQSEEET